MKEKGELLKTFIWAETKEEIAFFNEQQQSGKYSLVYREIIRKGNHQPIIKVYGIKNKVSAVSTRSKSTMGKSFGGFSITKAKKAVKSVVKKEIKKDNVKDKKVVKKEVKAAVKKGLKPIVRKINKLQNEIQKVSHQAGLGELKLHSHHGSRKEAEKVIAELRGKGHIVRGLDRRGRIAVYYK